MVFFFLYRKIQKTMTWKILGSIHSSLTEATTILLHLVFIFCFFLCIALQIVNRPGCLIFSTSVLNSIHFFIHFNFLHYRYYLLLLILKHLLLNWCIGSKTEKKKKTWQVNISSVSISLFRLFEPTFQGARYGRGKQSHMLSKYMY